MGSSNSSSSESKDVIASDNNEITVIIWLDGDIYKKIEYQNVQQQLQTIVSRLKIFDDEKQCGKYILSLAGKERLILIVNDQQGEMFVPFIHPLRQVISIYVYRKDQKGCDQWTKRCLKVKAVVKGLDEVISRIKTDQEHFLSVQKTKSISSSMTDIKTKQSKKPFISQFAYSQLLSNVLLRSKPNENDKTELISLCHHMYKTSESDLEIIDEFQHSYSSHKALWWYTRLNCFDKILNQALRTQDIHTIFLFQFFIHDLYQQITECQCQYPIRVYRSQLMIDDEINSLKESVGSFISIHTFFSTVVDRNRALGFLNTSGHSNDFHRVFFEIDADPAMVTTKPFADITRYSYFPDEREVLFSVGSIFRITDVHRGEDQVWIIHMTLCCDDESDLKPLFEEIEIKYGSYDGDVALFSFSRMLREMQKFDEAQKYCHRLFSQFSSNDLLLSVLYDELAAIASHKTDAQSSNHWHETATQQKEHNESDDQFTSIQSIDDDHDQNSTNNLRFTDVAAENHDILLPIEGHERMPLVSLEEAVHPLTSILPDIRRKVHTAKLKCKNPADGLTPDQSAAIMLYTMEWEPQNQCLYFALNASLRAADRNKLKPWFLYLKLVLTGLSRLPSIQRTVYRGVRIDLSSEHREGDQFFWWGFSSCTTSMNVLKSQQYLGDNGIRTLFNIECTNGKDIRRHSYYQKEDEILLLPATFFEVMSSFRMASDLHLIQLRERKPEFPYLEPVT